MTNYVNNTIHSIDTIHLICVYRPDLTSLELYSFLWPVMEENINNGKNTKVPPEFVQKSLSRLSKIVIDVLAENRIISTIIQLLSKRNKRQDKKICLDVSSQTSEDDICHIAEVILDLDNPGLSMEHSQDLEADNTVTSIESSMSSVDYNDFIDTLMIMMFLNQVLRLFLMFLQKLR